MIIVLIKTIGEKRFGMNSSYKTFKTCRFCNSKEVIKVIDLGKMPLAGGFIKNKKDLKKEKKYPISLNFCKKCYLLQTSVAINPDILFRSNYFYHSSAIKTLVEHFQQTAFNLKKTLKKNSKVLEIGCNDGAFVEALEKNGYTAIGVDPATNIVNPLIKAGKPIINAYFSEKVAKKILKKYGNIDAIYSFHALAHITDMHDVLRGIKLLLKPEGFLAFEVHYLGNLLEGMQYDMIYHEHLHYYSLISLQNFFKQYDMEIFDYERSEVRAGSILFYVQNSSGERKVSPSVKKLQNQELKLKLDKPAPYLSFDKKIKHTRKELLGLLNELKTKKITIAGYGASGRGTVILNYCGLNSKFIDFIVDDAPAKHNCYMPGTHNPIYSPSKLTEEDIKYAVVFAWPFIKEVKNRNKLYLDNKGKFILPLPRVKITK